MIIIVNRIVLSDGRDILIILILNSDKPRLGANTCANHVTFITRNFRLHRVQMMTMLIACGFMCVFCVKYFN